MANSLKSAAFLMDSRLADAARGNVQALFDLGVAYSTGSGGIDVDLIETNLALSVQERWRQHDGALRFILKLQQAKAANDAGLQPTDR